MAEKYPDTLWEIPQPNTNKNKEAPKEKLIALTIDDAPSAYTLDILHLLQKYNARATFFLIGSQIPGREGILHTLVKSGMELGNHAMHDEPSVSLGKGVLEQEMQEVEGGVIGWAGVNAWHVRSLVREGSIVVMHDRRSWTVEGLRRVLPVLRDRGFRVVGLGEAMGIVDAANAAVSGDLID
ncbi:glycoside hydrolase/deacetylase [Aspergillus eucalypticola CBS 122712]|uniref:chitin deacetylase n=1 Tax=Aspergillus eucalypticola (strain CBS 122712 / IBT 29274) TaxID=1448314 RepID=A0A317VL96_ASPEC|nr:glycoside hydrolase/deacetylase [Aspergillus eucalypticola CBS 122712]PWY73907.1 glycoside hydrolase/deacetylase [Aspergillus eucalypticola CBS 122712]